MDTPSWSPEPESLLRRHGLKAAGVIILALILWNAGIATKILMIAAFASPYVWKMWWRSYIKRRLKEEEEESRRRYQEYLEANRNQQQAERETAEEAERARHRREDAELFNRKWEVMEEYRKEREQKRYWEQGLRHSSIRRLSIDWEFRRRCREVEDRWRAEKVRQAQEESKRREQPQQSGRSTRNENPESTEEAQEQAEQRAQQQQSEQSTWKADPEDSEEALRIKQSAVWFAKAVYVLENKKRATRFPQLPLWTCTVPACQVNPVLNTCSHNVKLMLMNFWKPYREVLRQARTDWHPDRFAACQEEAREDIQKAATEFAKILNALWDELKKEDAENADMQM